MIQARPTNTKLINIICANLIPGLLLMLFAYTGTAKLIGHSIFLHQLAKMPVIKQYAVFISCFIPVSELLIAMLLVFPALRTWGLLLSVLLMLLFTTFVAFILTGQYVPCSCGGILSKMSWAQHLIFNIAFTILSITSLWYHKSLHVYKGVSRKP